MEQEVNVERLPGMDNRVSRIRLRPAPDFTVADSIGCSARSSSKRIDMLSNAQGISARSAGGGLEYRRKNPESTALNRIVQEHLETILTSLESWGSRISISKQPSESYRITVRPRIFSFLTPTRSPASVRRARYAPSSGTPLSVAMTSFACLKFVAPHVAASPKKYRRTDVGFGICRRVLLGRERRCPLHARVRARCANASCHGLLVPPYCSVTPYSWEICARLEGAAASRTTAAK